MADKNVKKELNAENLEGVAGGVGAKVKTKDIGKNKTGNGSDKGGKTKGSKVNNDNIENENSGDQGIIDQGRGNEIEDSDIKFN